MRTRAWTQVVAVVLAAFCIPCAAQKPGGSTKPAPSRPSAPSTSLEPEVNRIYLIQGTVRTEEGGRLPAPAVIERVCAGSVVREGTTDSGGRFSVQVGQSMATTQDASTDPTLMQKGPIAPPILMSAPNIVGCEIRAALAGYRSNSVALADRLHGLTIDVGTLVLHPIAKTEGVTVSATSLSAPKDARKAVENGRKKVEKEKYADAMEDFKRAVELHPAYAEAWYLLGEVQARVKDLDSAGASYRRAIAADARYVPPYMGLALIAASRMAWADLAESTDHILALDPSSSALAYFYSAVANYNLDRLDVAEQRALRADQLDAQRRLPRIQLLLAEILVGKKDFAGAAERLRTFLRWAPNGKEADAARSRLAELQNDSAQTKPQDE